MKIQCPICPRTCSLEEGQIGACGARKALNHQSVPIAHGLLSAIHIDPVEKKPLNHYFPGSSVLSLGSFGCNLMCRGCQNDSISRTPVSQGRGTKRTPTEIVNIARQNACPLVAYTYNEPIVWGEFVDETARAAHEAGLKNIMVTAGYVTPETRQWLFRHIDAANVDLKGFSEDFYRTWANAELAPVLETLEYLHEIPSFWLEITTLLIPGINDAQRELEAEFAWIHEHLGNDVPLHLSAFHPAHKAVDIPCTPAQTLLKARELAVQAGLHYVYLGNLPLKSDTKCPQCSHTLIHRMGFRTQVTGMNGNKCANCGLLIPGIWA